MIYICNFRFKSMYLNKIILLLFFTFFCLITSYSQKIFAVDYASQADIKVFVTKYASQADLLVFKVKFSSQSSDNLGNWFFVEYASQADKKIYYCKYASESDLKIYFVDYESQSKWRKNEKRHMFF